MSEPYLERAFSNAKLLRSVRPGRLMFFAHATYGTWMLEGVSLEQFNKALQTISKDGSERISSSDPKAPYMRVVPTENPNKISLDLFVGKLLFLDLMDMRVTELKKDDGNCLKIEYVTESAGFSPASSSHPVTIGCIFFLMPFVDLNRMTTKESLWVKDRVDQELGIMSSMTCRRYLGCI